ncbi:MAG: MraY family glycosyltransferase [Patescibacteria group bacterium]
MQTDLVIHFSVTFLAAAALSCFLTFLVRSVAVSLRIVDTPGEPRKIHGRPVPLLGGAALYATILVVVAGLAQTGWLTDDRVSTRLLWGIVLAGAVIMLVGFLDDAFRLTWWQQMLGPILAVSIMIAAGLEIPFVTNPFGTGVLDLGEFFAGGMIVPTEGILIFLWLLGMMYTTKLLDGVDGLASSISFVATLVIFVVSLFWDHSGSTTSFLALTLAGAILGFLVWNWHPAKIFLGEGGSIFLGFMLGVLAIISGGKIATALLVMGVPILDVLWIIGRRLVSGQRIFSADKKHLHFRLLQAGMTQRQVALSLALVSLAFGSVSFVFGTRAKLIALAVLLVFMLGLALVLVRHEKKRGSI